jgi:hypothetical protein
MNLKRHSYDYVVGQQVLKNIHAPTKLGFQKEGPYIITQVHTDGNVSMELRPGVTERINICRISPYRTPTRFHLLTSIMEGKSVVAASL